MGDNEVGPLLRGCVLPGGLNCDTELTELYYLTWDMFAGDEPNHT